MEVLVDDLDVGRPRHEALAGRSRSGAARRLGGSASRRWIAGCALLRCCAVPGAGDRAGRGRALRAAGGRARARARRADRARQRRGRGRRGPPLLARPLEHRPERADGAPPGAAGRSGWPSRRAAPRASPTGSAAASPDDRARHRGRPRQGRGPLPGRAARRARARGRRRGPGDRLRLARRLAARSRARAGAEVLEIAPDEFGHGRTRNLGAERDERRRRSRS